MSYTVCIAQPQCLFFTSIYKGGRSFTVDAFLQATIDEDFTVDGLIQAQDNDETFTALQMEQIKNINLNVPVVDHFYRGIS